MNVNYMYSSKVGWDSFEDYRSKRLFVSRDEKGELGERIAILIRSLWLDELISSNPDEVRSMEYADTLILIFFLIIIGESLFLIKLEDIRTRFWFPGGDAFLLF